MDTLNISLPKSMKGFVESQLKVGGYATASEYVRDLIREAQKRTAREKLEQMLLDGLDSGPAVRADEAFWRRKSDKLIQNARKKKASR
jgi:antitoxin ParD1/3/4